MEPLLRTNYKTIRELVTEELRNQVVSGHFKLGQKLDETELASGLGVSRMPVRQAIQQLASEGLVQAQPHVGATVISLTAEDVRDIFDARIALEGLLAGLAAQVITSKQCDQLEVFLTQQSESLTKNDYASFHMQNNAFHKGLYDLSKRKRTCQIVRDLRVQSALLMNNYLRLPLAGERALQEHLKILDACRRHDAPTAEQLVRDHVGHTATVALDLIASRESNP